MQGTNQGKPPCTHCGDIGTRQTAYLIRGMDCAEEEALIRKKLAGMPGIIDLRFDLIRRVLTVRHNLDSSAPLEATLESIGMRGERVNGGPKAATSAGAGEERASWIPLLLGGLAALGAELFAFSHGDRWPPVLLLSLTAITVTGLSTYKKGWIAIKNLDLNMNALMSFAVTGALIIGQWPEAAMVMTLFTLAERIEAKSMQRAREAIDSLMRLAPERATVLMPDGSWSEVEAKAVRPGARIRVRPGERIALDGQIATGHSAVDQSPITGESLPADKGPGDPVYAGTINTSGSFEYTASAPADDSTLTRILHTVAEAQTSRAPIQRFVDRFARIYTPAVFLAALLAASLPPLVLDASWSVWAYRALVLLVIACPCALVISIPVSIVSALSAASRHGILVKGGLFLEEGRKLVWIALDKTGTITAGRPELTACTPQGTLSRNGALTLAASLTARSDHPVSLAITRAAGKEGLPLYEVTDFAALPGQGIQGQIQGKLWRLGKRRMAEEAHLCPPALAGELLTLEEEGKSIALLFDGEGIQALFAVADSMKKSSIAAIAELKQLGIRTMMLSGDHEHTARIVAAQAGVDDYKGNLLPEDKLAAVEELARNGPIGMAGDGINDAPALAKADIGFAMGAAGSDVTIETADVALMDDDLRKIPLFIRLSRATCMVLRQNIALTLGIKLIFCILAFLGQASMWMAVFADVGVSLIVVANGLRLLRK